MSIKKIPLSKVDITPEEEFEIVQKWQKSRTEKYQQELIQEQAEMIHEQLDEFSFEDKKKILALVQKMHNDKVDNDVSEMEEDVKLVEDAIIQKAKQKF